ncbi:hypothetical protein CWB41_13850 [Methylovirgula ligni]|uniref:Uncharacterized protein n=1 Tax=Methylovirgula ligni TaxID=569860 RepID=A0A3D9YR02_9HYPH|nr:hypothetical protein [Methylovirgula ligni]QAY96677.1 hypothetical protein CWB41_13850 [Methylovirgula ligni]REF83282.1 hypothetical protein DES32_3198 [Methylovirgula ligni]
MIRQPFEAATGGLPNTNAGDRASVATQELDTAFAAFRETLAEFDAALANLEVYLNRPFPEAPPCL